MRNIKIIGLRGRLKFSHDGLHGEKPTDWLPPPRETRARRREKTGVCDYEVIKLLDVRYHERKLENNAATERVQVHARLILLKNISREKNAVWFSYKTCDVTSLHRGESWMNGTLFNRGGKQLKTQKVEGGSKPTDRQLFLFLPLRRRWLSQRVVSSLLGFWVL